MAFVLRRLLHGGFVLLVMSLLVFVAVYAIGNPVDLLVDPNADAADKARTMAALGLDQPLFTQYLHFLKGALTGDLGHSFIHGTPAVTLILERMPATLELAVTALLLALVVGLPLGLWAGARKGWPAKVVEGIALLGFSLPTFWVGLALILVFAVVLGWLPPGGRGPTIEILGIDLSCLSLEGWRYLLLPAATLALFKTSLLIRLTQQGTVRALAGDAVRFARSRGLSEARIVAVHVGKPLLTSLVTVVGMEFGSVIAFAVVTETIFGWPGMGKLLIESINTLDRPVIVAYLLVTTTLFVILNLLADLACAALDPRLRLGAEETGHG
ncbi:MAG: ABC transporter permease [Rhodocyclaceae bacterium]|nr:MAG: ABC transporter permease [Rhodocyclaceae bacterium]